MSKEEKKYKKILTELGCMVCRREYGITDSPVELHHLRTGGWGKGDFTTLIPLCVEHHRGDTGVHGLGTKGFEKHYGFSQQDILSDTIKLMEEKKAIYFGKIGQILNRGGSF